MVEYINCRIIDIDDGGEAYKPEDYPPGWSWGKEELKAEHAMLRTSTELPKLRDSDLPGDMSEFTGKVWHDLNAIYRTKLGKRLLLELNKTGSHIKIGFPKPSEVKHMREHGKSCNMTRPRRGEDEFEALKLLEALGQAKVADIKKELKHALEGARNDGYDAKKIMIVGSCGS